MCSTQLPLASRWWCGGGGPGRMHIARRFSDATSSDLAQYDDDCAICRERMSAAKKLSCGHLFHIDCIREWLAHHGSCPVCRRPVGGRTDGDAAATTHAAAAPPRPRIAARSERVGSEHPDRAAVPVPVPVPAGHPAPAGHAAGLAPPPSPPPPSNSSGQRLEPAEPAAAAPTRAVQRERAPSDGAIFVRYAGNVRRRGRRSRS